MPTKLAQDHAAVVRDTFNPIQYPHVVRSQQFSHEVIETLFAKAKELEKGFVDGIDKSLQGRRIALLFDRQSVRTEMSFTEAVVRLGGRISQKIIGLDSFSADMGACSLEHTIKVTKAFRPDAIVLRSECDDSMNRAIAVSGGIPIISAGDSEQHPSVSLGDLFTIYRQYSGREHKLSGLNIGVMGDLSVNVVRSLIYLLGKFGVSFYLISSPDHRINDGIRHHLIDHNITFEELSDVRQVVQKLHVLYVTTPGVTRSQTTSDGNFLIVDKQVMDMVGSRTIVMHPLPINCDIQEIRPEVESDPRVVCFGEQVVATCLIRMALLKHIIMTRFMGY